jgi:Xaa-Pro aminopeptidase
MLHARSAALSRRHKLVREAAARHSVDAVLVTSRPNIFYLTNFTGSSAIAVVTADRLHFITDFRYITAVESLQQSEESCPDFDLTVVDGTYDATLLRLLASLKVSRVGFEAAHLTVSRYNWLVDQLGRSTAVPPTLVPTEQLVEHLRVRKDADEIEIFREAARRLSAVARGVFEEIKAGRTEQEVARAIDARIIAGGFERTSFDTIVASGPQAALPHAHPTERMLGENDLVVLDFGGVYRSYCVDLTRTVAVGRASSRAREVPATR